MQTIGKNGEVLSAHEITLRNAYEQLQTELQKKDISHVVVGELPSRGAIVEINGLKFKVESRSRKGNLYLKMLGTEGNR